MKRGPARYANLAFTANTSRAIGAILQAVGVVVSLVGAGVAVYAGQHEDPFDGALPGWPLAATVLAVVFGTSLLLRGIAQAAQGEALLAVADIAVATSSQAPADDQEQWAGTRSLGRFAFTLAAYALLVLVAIGAGVSASPRSFEHTTSRRSTEEARTTRLERELDELRAELRQEKNRADALEAVERAATAAAASASARAAAPAPKPTWHPPPPAPAPAPTTDLEDLDRVLNELNQQMPASPPADDTTP